MLHELAVGEEFFASLFEFDEKIAQDVARAGCPRCGGPLYRSDYERKPRGGTIAAAGEAVAGRFDIVRDFKTDIVEIPRKVRTAIAIRDRSGRTTCG
jgi:hypothetical protein